LENLHLVNISVHVAAGSIALILGVVALISKKGGRIHKKAGEIFTLLLSVIILTGLFGVFVFGRNTFLLVITVLSAYYGFSGYRILVTKSNKPQFIDIFVALLSIIAVSYFLYYFRQNGMYWSPVIIYSTVGALLMVILYDFARYFIPSTQYGKLWLYEHIYKMIGAFTALLSAFTGTVFPNYKPYSQFLPSVFGTLMQVAFIVYAYRQHNSRKIILT